MKIVLRNVIPIVVFGLIPLAGCSGGGGGDGSGGDSCGGTSGNVCTATQYCKYEDLSCGLAGTNGVCTEVPVGSCDDPAVIEANPTTIVGPVCSCDRLEFKNDCWASQAQQSVQLAGSCP